MKSSKLFLTITIILTLLLVACTQTTNTQPNTAVQDSQKPTETQSTTSTVTVVPTAPSAYDTSKGFTDKNGCYDSEGGKFYEKKGYIIDTKQVRFGDSCLSQNTLQELYCNSVGYKATESYTCPNGCQDGACLSNSPNNLNVCTDSDFKDYTKKGSVTYKGVITFDSCKDATTLYEQICTSVGVASQEEKYCQYGCQDGICLQGQTTQTSTCTDSDLGTGEEFIKGTVTDPKGSIQDSCLNSGTVKEWKCNSAGYRTDKNIICANSCVDGACTK